MSDKKGVVLERLRELIDSSGKTREEIAKAIECDTSTITKHYNGNRQVAPEFIIKYAQFFGVSSDYLLGLSNAESTDKDIQIISKYTGLSDEAIKALNCFYKNVEYSVGVNSTMLSVTEIINKFIEENAIHLLSSYIRDYWVFTKLMVEDKKLYHEKMKASIEITEKERKTAYETFDGRDLALFRGQELVKDFMKELCREELIQIKNYDKKLDELRNQQLQDLVKEIDV